MNNSSKPDSIIAKKSYAFALNIILLYKKSIEGKNMYYQNKCYDQVLQ